MCVHPGGTREAQSFSGFATHPEKNGEIAAMLRILTITLSVAGLHRLTPWAIAPIVHSL
jgi:hypothetical protein